MIRKAPFLNAERLLLTACIFLSAVSANAAKILVDVQENADPAAVAARHGIKPDQIFTQASKGFSADVTSLQINKLESDDQVLRIVADRVIARIDLPRMRQSNSRWQRPGTLPYEIPPQPAQTVPFQLRRVNGDKSLTADIDGRDDRRVDADIAVIDTGVDPYHPDLNVVGGFDCLRNPAYGRGWYDYEGGPVSGHGTMVAGIAAALDNEIGTVGVAPGARIWAVRVSEYDTGSITLESYMCALEYVARNRHIDVFNASFVFEDDGLSPVNCVFTPRPRPRPRGQRKFQSRPTIDWYHERVCRLNARGVTFAAGAGNESVDAYRRSPALYPEVLAVSGMVDFDGKPGGLTPPPPQCWPTDVDDTFAEFSNYGNIIDISAPSVCHESTYPGGVYAIGDGTSFSTPMVAGAAALLYDQQPGITPERIRNLIRNRAQKGTVTGDPDGIDEGVLNVSTF